MADTFWAVDFWAPDFWAVDFWAGGVTPPTPPVVTQDGGGWPYGKKRRKPASDSTQGRFVSVDGTLYHQMFPPKPQHAVGPDLNSTKSPAEPDSAVPLALLAAFMAFDDE